MSYEDEFIDVHEGGEFSWLQRIADHLKLRGFRYEAHGDNIRIVIKSGFMLDFSSELEGLCFYTRTLLPLGDDYHEIDDYIKRARVFLEISSLMKRPVKYYIDDSLDQYVILNAKKCYKTFEEVIEIIDRLYDYFAKEKNSE